MASGQDVDVEGGKRLGGRKTDFLLEDDSARLVTRTRTICSSFVARGAGRSVLGRAGVVDAEFDDDPVAGMEGLGDALEAAFAGELHQQREQPF